MVSAMPRLPTTSECNKLGENCAVASHQLKSHLSHLGNEFETPTLIDISPGHIGALSMELWGAAGELDMQAYYAIRITELSP